MKYAHIRQKETFLNHFDSLPPFSCFGNQIGSLVLNRTASATISACLGTQCHQRHGQRYESKRFIKLHPKVRAWRDNVSESRKRHLLVSHNKSKMTKVLKNISKHELCKSLSRSFSIGYTLTSCLRQQQLFTDITACLFTPGCHFVLLPV